MFYSIESLISLCLISILSCWVCASTCNVWRKRQYNNERFWEKECRTGTHRGAPLRKPVKHWIVKNNCYFGLLMCLLLYSQLEELGVFGILRDLWCGRSSRHFNESPHYRSSCTHLLSLAVKWNNRKRIICRDIVFHRDMFCTQFSVKYVPFTHLMFQLCAGAAGNDIPRLEAWQDLLPGE